MGVERKQSGAMRGRSTPRRTAFWRSRSARPRTQPRPYPFHYCIALCKGPIELPQLRRWPLATHTAWTQRAEVNRDLGAHLGGFPLQRPDRTGPIRPRLQFLGPARIRASPPIWNCGISFGFGQSSKGPGGRRGSDGHREADGTGRARQAAEEATSQWLVFRSLGQFLQAPPGFSSRSRPAWRQGSSNPARSSSRSEGSVGRFRCESSTSRLIHLTPFDLSHHQCAD